MNYIEYVFKPSDIRLNLTLIKYLKAYGKKIFVEDNFYFHGNKVKKYIYRS